MSQYRRPLFVGNWKMNCLKKDGLKLAQTLANDMKKIPEPDFDLVICPQFTLLSAIETIISNSNIKLGAQNCHAENKGPYTGDVSSLMVAEVGCSYVIVGHADQRINHGETNSEVKEKAYAVYNSKMTPIICIGETREEYDDGLTFEVIKNQLSKSLPTKGVTGSNTVIAYEPIWAIGTGLTPTLEHVQAVHSLIRTELTNVLGDNCSNTLRILYGGSLNSKNAKNLLLLDDVDGGLIGSASLDSLEFLKIAKSSV